eukprot:CAMPEP_0175088802 /NCGR_PEP_ID=MMETSP0086_2-20121207/443_1 /TAXON_ID=136419 /ORGANISM="Unknown Unknown, Strain D1" /LENGTH=393 /DNA_ID=CAMNT_0016361261 /DNA_START=207 /DNA_END=1388 /DNA_ORIENTATION=-
MFVKVLMFIYFVVYVNIVSGRFAKYETPTLILDAFTIPWPAPAPLGPSCSNYPDYINTAESTFYKNTTCISASPVRDFLYTSSLLEFATLHQEQNQYVAGIDDVENAVVLSGVEDMVVFFGVYLHTSFDIYKLPTTDVLFSNGTTYKSVSGEMLALTLSEMLMLSGISLDDKWEYIDSLGKSNMVNFRLTGVFLKMSFSYANYEQPLDATVRGTLKIFHVEGAFGVLPTLRLPEQKFQYRNGVKVQLSDSGRIGSFDAGTVLNEFLSFVVLFGLSVSVVEAVVLYFPGVPKGLKKLFSENKKIVIVGSTKSKPNNTDGLESSSKKEVKVEELQLQVDELANKLAGLEAQFSSENVGILQTGPNLTLDEAAEVQKANLTLDSLLGLMGLDQRAQ